jgi:tetratricopeptide (TPR) repeat protein
MTYPSGLGRDEAATFAQQFGVALEQGSVRRRTTCFRGFRRNMIGRSSYRDGPARPSAPRKRCRRCVRPGRSPAPDTARGIVDAVSDLAEGVLPLIGTRADLWRWSTANEHGRQMHEAVAILRQAADSDDPSVVLAVTQKAIASALRVIMRADDSSGIIGAACRALLDLHTEVAARAKPPVAKLVDWMIKFQFDNECDYFTVDRVAYACALGDVGMASYRAKLAVVEARLGPRPSEDDRWTSAHSHDWFTLEWNAQRLSVLDRDVEAIIRTHARDQEVACWLQDTAEALAEIGEFDLAIEWARQALDVGPDHQSLKAGEYWCKLLAEHRPDELLLARMEVFRRWPSSSTAARLYRDADHAWPQFRNEVMERLAASPRDAVMFALLSLKDVHYAWELAHSLTLDDDRTWSDLVKAYEKIDPIAVLPVLNRLVLSELVETGAQHYRIAARRLKKMRTLAARTTHEAEIDHFIAELRETNRRRPRLQQEFDRAGLP